MNRQYLDGGHDVDSILEKDEDDSSDDETEELVGSVPVIG